MSLQFVACNAVDCPMNEGKQCRSPWIMVDKDGKCAIRDQPMTDKSQVETYVEIKECRCKSCDQWELNEVNKMGQCGFREDLFFRLRKTLDYKNKVCMAGPFCFTYEKQIDEPDPFAASNVPDRE